MKDPRDFSLYEIVLFSLTVWIITLLITVAWGIA